jgi:hypothetical protein
VKSVGAIKHKLGQVRFRHLKKRIEAELRPLPDNCLYHTVLPKHHTLGVRGVPIEHPAVGVCIYGATVNDTGWPLSPCDVRVDDGARARSCEKFCARRTKEGIKEDFQEKLDSMTLPEVASLYPDMAALIWVLDAGDVGVPEEVPEELPAQPEPVVEVTPDPVVVPPQEPIAVVTPQEPVSMPAPAAAPEEPKKPWYARLLGGL